MDIKNEFQVKGEELLKKIKELIKEGNIRRIIIKNENDETFLEIPLSVGIGLAVFAPVLAAVGALAAMASKFKIQIIKKDDPENSREG